MGAIDLEAQYGLPFYLGIAKSHDFWPADIENEYSIVRLEDSLFVDFEDNYPITIVADGWSVGEKFPGTLRLNEHNSLFYSSDQDLESPSKFFNLDVTIQDSLGVKSTIDFSITLTEDAATTSTVDTLENSPSTSPDTSLSTDDDCEDDDDESEECEAEYYEIECAECEDDYDPISNPLSPRKRKCQQRG